MINFLTLFSPIQYSPFWYSVSQQINLLLLINLSISLISSFSGRLIIVFWYSCITYPFRRLVAIASWFSLQYFKNGNPLRHILSLSFKNISKNSCIVYALPHFSQWHFPSLMSIYGIMQPLQSMFIQ